MRLKGGKGHVSTVFGVSLGRTSKPDMCIGGSMGVEVEEDVLPPDLERSRGSFDISETSPSLPMSRDTMNSVDIVGVMLKNLDPNARVPRSEQVR